jgi:hypothetical protein
MPTLSSSRVELPEDKYQPAAPRQRSNIRQAGDSPIQRSPAMLASLPGMGSGPDAVLRQFYSTRDVPQQRILVPGR